jgi:long-chain acyl-CoA synthetase
MERPWYAFYDKEVPQTIDYTKTTLKERFNRNAESNGDKAYVILKDIELSYRAANSMARRLANGLLALGVNKGDRVALMMPNIPQYPVSLMACYKIGAIAVPTNPLYTIPELAHQLENSGSESVIVMAPFADKVIRILKETKTPVKRILCVQMPGAGIEVEGIAETMDYSRLVDESQDFEPDILVRPEDIAMLQYTGGTTGISKGCVLTQANLMAMLEQTGAWCSPMLRNTELRTLAAIPLYHVYGMNCNINLTLYDAGTMVLVPQPTPDNLLEAVNRHEPTYWAAVPTMIQGVLNHPDITQSRIGAVKLITSGGAPLTREVMKRFEKLSGARICEGYGLSETSNILSANPAGIRKPGSVGIPWPDVDMRIVDLETGKKQLPPDVPGEIIAKGPQIMARYWNNPDETTHAIRDGWLHTGDIGSMDTDGYIYILDRKKDMIICSGFNVYPREVDEVLYTHPKVCEACAIGVPDDKRGETVKVYVVVKSGESLAGEELIDYCRQRLAPYKLPKIVEFIDQLPKTPVGKIDRKALRAFDVAKRNQP